jgi:hypothetical protein
VYDNSYLCNQLGNALFCVTSGIFAGRAQRDPAKSHELPFVSNHLRNYNYKLYLENYTLQKILSLLLFTIIINNNYRPMKNYRKFAKQLSLVLTFY